jgi:hypothetical protein
MSEDQFKALCNTYGFAPSRALRELIDCVIAQEIAACVRLAEETKAPFTADVIRARKDKQ